MRIFSNRGFTLMEVVVAMAVLGTALGISLYTSDLIGSNYSISHRTSRAHEIAGTIMEELLSVYNSDGKLTEGDHSQGYDEEGRLSPTSNAYLATWTIKANAPISKIIEIKLTVSWDDAGKSRTVRYVTFRKS